MRSPARDATPEVAVFGRLLAGEDDILIPTSLSGRLREAIPGSEWATTKGGHACLWERPEPFNGAILRFLGRQRA